MFRKLSFVLHKIQDRNFSSFYRSKTGDRSEWKQSVTKV